jgi:hypothetical protein
MTDKAIVILLPSIHHVLKSESVLKKKALVFDLIPVPKEINPDCGMALEVPPDSAHETIEALTTDNIPIEAVYLRQGSTFTPHHP